MESYIPVQKIVKSTFQSTYDLKLLQFYLDYVQFQLKKFVDDQELFQLMSEDAEEYDAKEPQFKRIKKRNFAKECMKYNLHEVANQIVISPDHLAENLLCTDQRFKPKIINDTPDKIATEYSNPDVPIIDMPVKTLTTLCDYIALELFNHPIIRKHLKKLYNDRVTVNTEPTSKGQVDITVYNFYYPCKRIRNMKPIDFGNELWLMMKEAEEKGLIKIQLRLPWDKEEEKDEIRQRLLDLYLLEVKSKKCESDELNAINAWNIVREETISKLLKSYVYPSFEKALIEELSESSEKYVINESAKAFKESINIQPYKKTPENGESEAECSKFKVLSCIAESHSGKTHFCLVDEYGELMDHMSLSLLSKPSNDDYSLRQMHNMEKDALKNFMLKTYPDLIVVGTTSLSCQQVKLELDNIAQEALNDIRSKNPKCTLSKPFVMWGITLVPNAYAQSYKASKDYPEFDFYVKKALSLARLVQDPLAETLHLWSERLKENLLLYISYHTMQVIFFPTKNISIWLILQN